MRSASSRFAARAIRMMRLTTRDMLCHRNSAQAVRLTGGIGRDAATILENHILNGFDDKHKIPVEAASGRFSDGTMKIAFWLAHTADHTAKSGNIIIDAITVHRGCNLDNLREKSLYRAVSALTDRTGPDRIGVETQRADARMDALDDAVVVGHGIICRLGVSGSLISPAAEDGRSSSRTPGT